MDPVRFGRALGAGARFAAKTAVTAVDAALAPNPNAPPAPAAGTAQRTAGPAQATAPPPRRRPIAATTTFPPPSRQSVRHLAKALSSPVRRLSGVLWLELTGVFFGLFALTAAVGAWRLRGAWRSPPATSSEHTHLLLTLAVALIFAYFCVSSFVRARRRSRLP